MAVYNSNHTKHLNTSSGQNADVFNVKVCLQAMYRHNCTLNVNHMPAFAHCLFHHMSNVADVAEQQMWHGDVDDETTWNIPEFFTGWWRGC